MSHFNEVANEWDSPEKINLMNNLATETKKHLRISDGIDVLDFGCGTGLFGLHFLENAKTLTGIDTSKGMLDVFKRKVDDDQKLKTLMINLENEDHQGHYDLIVSSMAFHHLENPVVVLKKLKQMLKPNGVIAIIDLDHEDGTFHPDNNAMGVKHFGFSNEILMDWATKTELSIEHHIINSINKNDKIYQQFLCLYR